VAGGAGSALEMIPSLVSKVKDIDFSEQDPNIGEAHVQSIDYVQELQGAVLTFSNGSIYMYKNITGGDQEEQL